MINLLRIVLPILWCPLPRQRKLKSKIGNRRRRLNRDWLRTWTLVAGLRLPVSLTTTVSSSSTTVSSASTTASTGIRHDSARHCFRGDACTNLDIRLFEDKTTFDWSSACAAELGTQDPFVVSFCESIDWNGADASAVVAAFARSKANSPFGLRLVLA